MGLTRSQFHQAIGCLYSEGRKDLSYILANFSDWNSGVWIHYSAKPFLKLNPKPYHNDPLGIYLFPKKFKTEGNWTNYRYKFYCSLSGLNILDLSEWDTYDKAVVLCEKLNITLGEDAKTYIRKEPSRGAWNAIRDHYLGKGASFNKALRSIGFNAVFDDTKAIHVAEKQLLVLDPSKITVLDMVDQKIAKGSGFKEVDQAIKYLSKKLTSYGNIKITPAKRGTTPWDKKIIGVIDIKNGDNYAGLKLTPDFNQTGVLENIYCSIQYSNPRLDYGSGSTWNITKGKISDLYKEIKSDLNKIFGVV